MEGLFILLLVGLTSVGAYWVGAKGFGLSGRVSPVIVVRTARNESKVTSKCHLLVSVSGDPQLVRDAVTRDAAPRTGRNPVLAHGDKAYNTCCPRWRHGEGPSGHGLRPRLRT